MKHFFSLLIISIVSLSVSAQTEKKIYYDRKWKAPVKMDSAMYYRIVKFDETGKPIGKITDYYISGEKQSDIDGALKIDSTDDHNSVFIGESKRYYKSGKKESVTKRDNQGLMLSSEGFYEDGKPWYSVSVKNGKENGPMKYWYESGSKKAIINYIDGKKEGDAHWYYDDGTLKEVATFQNDSINGENEGMHPNGMLAVKVTYVHGKKEGELKRYNNDGKLIAEVNYKNNKREGVEKNYYANGNIMVEENYVNDSLDGEYKRYYANGNINVVCNYKNGKLDGIGTRYYENGAIDTKVPYEDGKMNGTAVSYWSNGKEMRVTSYSYDKKTNMICMDSTGKVVECNDKPFGYGDNNNNRVLTIVQQMPQAPFDINQYLSTNIKYPEKERSKGITGTVFVNFIVEPDGAISNVRLLKGVDNGPGLNAEAIRVISSMPKWKPGMQDGKPVRVSYNVPIRFVLN